MTKRPRQEGTAMLPSNLHVPEDCRAVSEVLARVGDKWTILVVGELGNGPRRFNEIRRALGSISQRMLTLTLRGPGYPNRVPDHPAARRLRTDQARPLAAGTGQRYRVMGAATPRGDPAGAAALRRHEPGQAAMTIRAELLRRGLPAFKRGGAAPDVA